MKITTTLFVIPSKYKKHAFLSCLSLNNSENHIQIDSTIRRTLAQTEVLLLSFAINSILRKKIILLNTLLLYALVKPLKYYHFKVKNINSK